MTTPRSQLVDPNVSRWYHCISRCVRQAFLLCEGFNRKKWLEERLCSVSGIFAVSVGSFAILDNHLHFLLRLDPDVAANWSAEEVVNRWARLHPPRRRRKPVSVTPEWIAAEAQNTERVEVLRKRLCSLGWFMKEIKEPLARIANKEDNCKGAFFEGRYKSIILLDEESILSVSAYIDLNAVSAGTAATPESGPYTSLHQRVAHVHAAGREGDLAEALLGSVPACRASGDLEDTLWLIPIEDRRKQGSDVEGMIEGFTLGNYLLLVDYTGKLKRADKVAIPQELDGVFERLGTSVNAWAERQFRLAIGSITGRVLAATREALRSASARLGLHHCVNMNGCPVT